MKKSIKLSSIILILIIFGNGSFGLASNGVLRVHPTNSRYLTDNSGKPIYVTGSHTWDLIQWKTAGAPPATEAEFDQYLNWAQNHGHNFIRLWTNMSYAKYQPYPWQRTGPGTAAMDGLLKFDMTKFNQTYFDMLKGRIQKIQNRGMYASVMFFGSFNGIRSNIANTAWGETNNVNSALATAFTSDGHSFCTTNSSALDIERALVRKTIDELNGFDNIVWEIINEMGDTSPSCVTWHRAMIDYVKQYEAAKPKKHLVGMTGGWGLGVEMLSGNHDWISPDEYSMGYYEGGPAAFTDYVVISDTDHIRNPWGTGWGFSEPQFAEDMRKWVWKTFLRGNNPIFMDSYKADLPEYENYLGVINPVFDGVRKEMGYTLAIFKRFSEPALMIPSDLTTNCSTKYCLRNPGKAYLIYQPVSGSFTVNLMAGNYAYEWINPHTGLAVSKGNITAASGNKSFSAPSAIASESLLYLYSSLIGDLNNDGKVDIADYSMFIQDFGKTGTNLPADLNKNGQVEIGDYSIFISNFGKTS